jgi:nucleoside-diphosphate-sugar epimerase
LAIDEEEVVADHPSGIMSGGSEANFPLGYAVNVDSHLNLLKASHAHAEEHFQAGAKPRYVFVSSLAVYGGPKARPESLVVPE